jgi:Asp-tRNA(Asn)/Glu-tRNA(Gln) amidotransferase A subunit family amidase
VGLQLVGRRWQDEALLAVGRAVESLLWPAGLPYPPLAGAG